MSQRAPKRGFVADLHISWDDERASDIDRRIAIAATMPYEIVWRPNEQYSTFDRVEFQRYLGPSIQALASEMFPDEAEFSISTYGVGPAAGGPWGCLITAVSDVLPWLADATALIALAQFAKAAWARVQRWSDEAKVRHGKADFRGRENKVMFSAPLIVGLCYEHCVDTYSTALKPDPIIIDRSFRSEYPDYSYMGHPGGMGHYTVRIWTGQTSILYLVDCFGWPRDHFQIRGRSMRQLPLPNWFGELLSYQLGTCPVDSVAVRRPGS